MMYYFRLHRKLPKNLIPMQVQQLFRTKTSLFLKKTCDKLKMLIYRVSQGLLSYSTYVTCNWDRVYKSYFDLKGFLTSVRNMVKMATDIAATKSLLMCLTNQGGVWLIPFFVFDVVLDKIKIETNRTGRVSIITT